MTLTRETVDLLWPEHNRTSCSDDNLANKDVHHDNGASRCNRCMGLDRIGEPLSELEITADIKVRQPQSRGTVVVFRDDIPLQSILDALDALDPVLKNRANLYTFNPDRGGPVWYIP